MIDRLFFIVPWVGDESFWSLQINFAGVLRLVADCYLAPHLHDFFWIIRAGFGHRTDRRFEVAILRRLCYQPDGVERVEIEEDIYVDIPPVETLRRKARVRKKEE